MLTVETAAIAYEDGTVYTLPRPARHHNVQWLVVEKGVHNSRKGEEGFVLSDGSFVGRKQAKLIAVAADQLLKDLSTPTGLSDRVSTSNRLYSECIFEGGLLWPDPTTEELQDEIVRLKYVIQDLSTRLRKTNV